MDKFRISERGIKGHKYYIVKKRVLLFFWWAVDSFGTIDEAYNFIEFVEDSKRAKG